MLLESVAEFLVDWPVKALGQDFCGGMIVVLIQFADRATEIAGTRLSRRALFWKSVARQVAYRSRGGFGGLGFAEHPVFGEG
jgi:hypothetical protein